MAMWNPDGFKKVRETPDVNANGLNVSGPWDIEVLEEVAPAAGAAGGSQPKWLKVRAFSPDGETIKVGFMLQEWLKPIPAEIDREVFARACLAAAQDQGTSAEFLLSFADLVSKVSNPPPTPSTACGPFQFSEDVWKDALAADSTLDLQPIDRFRPYLQPSVAASIAARMTAAKPDTTAENMSLVLLFGQRQADTLLAQDPAKAFDEALRAAFQNHAQGAALADLKIKEDPAQLYNDPVAKKMRSLAEVVSELNKRLQPLFEQADSSIGGEAADESATSPPPVAMAGQLALGANEVYRDALVFAAGRTKFAVAALAALIDAEAAKGKTGLWDPVSDARPLSSALGLTQFLKDTWLNEAKKAATFLNEEARRRGFINGPNVSRESDLLALRTDPRQAITAAAEYAVANLAQLASRGVTVEKLMAQDFSLTPKTGDVEGNKARLAYLAHHEGFGGALAIIQGTLKESPAEKLLRTNNRKNADKLRNEAGSWQKAYTAWLFDYIRDHIVPAKFTAKPAGPAVGVGAPPKTDVKAPKPAPAADLSGTVQLTEAHLIGLWRWAAFPIDGRGIIIFGIRGCLPVDQKGTDFAGAHPIRFGAVNYKTMNCTIGQWKPGAGLALFPGSTVPFSDTVRAKIAAGGAGVNQLGPGRYPEYRTGFHKRSEGQAGHWALLQGCPLVVQRTGDDAVFDASDRWEVGEGMGDNIHCAFHMGPAGQISNSSFSSAGCQTIAGTIRKGAPGSAQGPWAKFIAPFERGKQPAAEYVLFLGTELRQMVQDQFRGQTIVLRMGSQGEIVKELQRRLSAVGQAVEPDGGFGAGTFKAVINFQANKFDSKARTGTVDQQTAAALGFQLPLFDFDNAIAGGTGQSKTPTR